MAFWLFLVHGLLGVEVCGVLVCLFVCLRVSGFACSCAWCLFVCLFVWGLNV